MLNDFKHHIDSNLAFLQESRLLVAISGGLDSVVLTHLCYELNLDCALVHCNFNLRGKESDADEDFVLKLAARYKMEVFVKSFDTSQYSEKNKVSIQMAARELRYQWFDSLCKDLKFEYVLTAHHADDSIETFLINLSRGTGVEGLTGIPEINGLFVRPLLPFSREDIQGYAKEVNLKWREDSSNASTKYLRNTLRHNVIPEFKKCIPQFLNNALKTMDHLKQASYLLNDYREIIHTQALDFTKNKDLYFRCKYFDNKLNKGYYLYHLFKVYNFTEWNDITELLTAQTGKFVRSKTHQLLKNREHLILSKIDDFETRQRTIVSESDMVHVPEGLFTINSVHIKKDNTKNVIYVDGATLQFPLELRTWREGDLFCPLGMSGKKKLSKYFKDEKLSLNDKHRTWLLCSENKIVWIVGHRADNRFRITEDSASIIKIEFIPTDTI